MLGDDHLLLVVILLLVLPASNRPGLQVRHAVAAVLRHVLGLSLHLVTDLVTLQHDPGGLLLALPG